MKILILTGKFGMGHYSASQSLRLQLLGAFPGSQVEVVDLPDYAIPDASEAIYKASQEAINVIKLRIRMVDAQITRIWNSGDTTQGGYL